MRKFKTVKQIIDSYIVAHAVVNYTQKDNGEMRLVCEKDYLLIEELIGNIKNKRAKDLFAKFSEFAENNIRLLYIAKRALEDIERFKFSEDPSISKNAKDNEHLARQYSYGYTELSKIDLATHTYNVFEIGLSNAKDMNKNVVVLDLLACLLHDFGKSSKIRRIMIGGQTQNSQNYISHPVVSSYYVNNILKKEVEAELSHKMKKPFYITKTAKELSFLVENHHNATKENEEKIAFIKKADFMAREMEFNAL